jgi:exopolyphosphatase/guanosine-5'-triphosphate,3'-diphosphate pyrophosphatase
MNNGLRYPGRSARQQLTRAVGRSTTRKVSSRSGPTRIAAIDIGSNSIHMAIVRLHRDGHFEVVDRAKEMVGLGRGTLVRGRLSAEAIEAGFRTLAAFTQLARKQGAEPILAVATAAVREAENGGELVLRAWEDLGLRVDVITGSEEARLAFEAARHSIDFRGQRPIVVDVGGGSVEIIMGVGPRIEWQESLKLGVARLTDRFIHSDPPRKSEIAALRAHLERKLESAFERAVRFQPTVMVGTSGTLLNLTAIAVAMREGQAPANLHNHVLRRDEITEIARALSSMRREERERVPALDRRRVDLIVAGSILTETLFNGFGVREMRACEWGLREGIILDFLARFPDYAETIARTPDIRRRSVLEMARRFEADEPHARQVARLALRLFDATRALHHLGRHERELLEYAALLHDVGLYVSHSRHHHHSHYLITHGEMLRGFTPEEVVMIATLARFHKGAPLKGSVAAFGAVPPSARSTVMQLAGILRVADALDRSHHGVVRNLRVRRPGSRRMLIGIDAAGSDAELEIWAARRKSELMAKCFGLELEFRMSTLRNRRVAGRARRAVSHGLGVWA